MYKLVFFVPEVELEQVKAKVFESGAGRIGDYSECCWQTLGQGQFRPSSDANPHIGQQGELVHVPEYKVELVCNDGLIAQAVQALKQAHPYEEPAYEVVKLEDI